MFERLGGHLGEIVTVSVHITQCQIQRHYMTSRRHLIREECCKDAKFPEICTPWLSLYPNSSDMTYKNGHCLLLLLH